MKNRLGFALVIVLGMVSAADARPSDNPLVALFYGPGCNPNLAAFLSDEFVFGEGQHHGRFQSKREVYGNWYLAKSTYGFAGHSVSVYKGEFLIVHGIIKDEVLSGSALYLNLSSFDLSGIYHINEVPDENCKPQPDEKGKSKPDGKG